MPQSEQQTWNVKNMWNLRYLCQGFMYIIPSQEISKSIIRRCSGHREDFLVWFHFLFKCFLAWAILSYTCTSPKHPNGMRWNASQLLFRKSNIFFLNKARSQTIFFTTSYVIANAVPLLSFPNPNKFKFVPACWSSSTKQTSGRKSSILRLHIQMAYCFRAFLSVLQMTWPYQYLASLRLGSFFELTAQTRLHRSAPLLNHGLSWAICLHAGELDFWITDDSSNLGSVKAAMPPHCRHTVLQLQFQ